MKTPSFRSLASSCIALVLTGAVSLAVPPAPAVEDVKTGSASLTLTTQVTGLLALAGVQFIKVAPGTVSPAKGRITVPITGGALDTNTGDGEAASGGGFKFVKDAQEVSAIDYVVTFSGGQGTVSALITVNNVLLGRTSLATFPSPLTTPVPVPANKKIKLQNLALKLSAAAATALNSAFSTSVFSAGQDLGAYDINIVLAKKPL